MEVCDADFRVLFVCTGNICRSPLAEILTQHLLVGRLGGRAASQFHVSSAGVQAVAGASMHPDSRVQLSPRRVDSAAADQFVARQLRSSMVTSAHLVLGASPQHRSAVVERAPEALANTFGLREFARLASFVDASTLPSEPVARAHALIDEVRLARGLAPPAEPDGDRVPDPMGKSPAAHRQAAELIEDAVQAIVDVIAPPLRVVRRA